MALTLSHCRVSSREKDGDAWTLCSMPHTKMKGHMTAMTDNGRQRVRVCSHVCVCTSTAIIDGIGICVDWPTPSGQD